MSELRLSRVQRVGLLITTDSSKAEDEVQLPLIQRGIQDGGGLEMR